MTVVAERPAPPTSVAALQQRPLPGHRRVAAVTAIAGVALALLAGRDGSLGWQIGSVVAIAAAHHRPRGGGRRASVTAAAAGSWGAVGVVVFAVGVGFMPYAIKDGLSSKAVAGTVAVVAGARARRRRHGAGDPGPAGDLEARRRRRHGRGRRRRRLRRRSGGRRDQRPAPDVAPPRPARRLAYETVTVTTDDGCGSPAGTCRRRTVPRWCCCTGPARLGPTCSTKLPCSPATGSGVLMIDARGHGDSGGRVMDFGWHGDADIAAATGYLADRPDVDRAADRRGGHVDGRRQARRRQRRQRADPGRGRRRCDRS